MGEWIVSQRFRRQLSLTISRWFNKYFMHSVDSLPKLKLNFSVLLKQSYINMNMFLADLKNHSYHIKALLYLRMCSGTSVVSATNILQLRPWKWLWIYFLTTFKYKFMKGTQLINLLTRRWIYSNWATYLNSI